MRERRGFVFTADALFALLMVAAVATMFSIYADQPEYSAKATAIQSLAYDFLVLNQSPTNLNGTVFMQKTGLVLSTSITDIPSNSMMTVYAAKYRYNNSCFSQDCSNSTGCKLTNTQANGSGSCLSGSAIDQWGMVKTQAWVST